jgi:hypothetical protein
MKKVYMKPTADIYEVEIQSVIATSPTIGINKETPADPNVDVDADERSSWGNLW